MATDTPAAKETTTDQPAKQPIEEALTYSIRNRGGWLTYTTDNNDAFLNEWQRRKDAGEDEADLNAEGGDPDVMLRAREEAEATAQRATQDATAAQTQRIADVKPKVAARATALQGNPAQLAKAVARLEFVVRGLVDVDDSV
jgi:hypothetical protein